MTSPTAPNQSLVSASSPYITVQYYALACDPIHVGTGGYRLGRVDLSIVREPGTRLPKLPGTSVSGVIRAYSAMATDRYRWQTKVRRTDATEVTVERSCAGQGQGDAQADGSAGGHCGSPYCPVCVSFGFARGASGGFQGLAQFADARVLFFPVHSLVGPVWVTSPSLLAEHGINVSVSADRVRLVGGLTVSHQRLNLGWLMLQTGESFTFGSNELQDVPPDIKSRVVVVSDKLLGQVVNDNLEVRTSVSIDPATGAADEGALFTYEALPRGTVLWFPITYSEPSLFRIKYESALVAPDPRIGAQPNGDRISVPETVVRGLKALEHLGIGGMNTRGMGRLRVLNPDAHTQAVPQAAQTTPETRADV